MALRFEINGDAKELPDSRGSEMLIDYLHEDLGLTGTKFCCGIGVCRACTVAVRKGDGLGDLGIACSTPLALLDGTRVTTIEGIGSPDALSAVQEAFLHHFSFQCGYCTPGFVIATTLLVDRLRARPLDGAALDAAIADAIGPHICRCTGYVRYAQAVRDVATAAMAGAAP